MATSATETRHASGRGPPGAAAADGAGAAARRPAPCRGRRSPPAIPALDAAAAIAAEAIGSGHRLAYAGAGSSGLMALADALELAGTFGIAARPTPVLIAGGAATLIELANAAEDDRRERRRRGRRGSASARATRLICVSASGATPYTVAVAEAARAARRDGHRHRQRRGQPPARHRRRRRAAGHRPRTGGRLDADGRRHGAEDRAQHDLDAHGPPSRPCA